ncbi:MAG: hypothetical protein JXR83_01990 [Deltaproteobacteria bacterium]|nr:hypothetical protein [Deltaproteobacteria bacterium]
MRALLAVTCLLPLLIAAAGCTDPHTGVCVGTFEYKDDPQIVPDLNPFRFCPIDPNARNPNGTPANAKLGAIVLTNCGRLSLEITSAELTSDGGGVFKNLQIAGTLPVQVAAGATVALQFTFESKDLLAHEGTISIKSNAENFPTLELGLYVPANGTVDASICQLVVPITDGGVED